MAIRPGILWSPLPDRTVSKAQHDHDTQKPRKRAAHRKSKDGCLTCRRRRIKCDEEQPVCSRCCRSGNTCEYLLPPGSRQSQFPLQPKKRVSIYVPASLQTMTLTEGDYMYFDTFRFHVVNRLIGYVTSKEYWRIIIPLAESDELFKHTTLAMGALYRTVIGEPGHLDQLGSLPLTLVRVSGKGSRHKNKHYQTAMKHHLKAMSLFRERIQDSDTMKSGGIDRVAVITSVAILFIAFEQLQGNYDGALRLTLHDFNWKREIIRSLKQRASKSTFLEQRNSDLERLSQLQPSWPKTQMNPLSSFLGFDGDLPPDRVVPTPLFPDEDDSFAIVCGLCRCDIAQVIVFMREAYYYRLFDKVNKDVERRRLKFNAIQTQWLQILTSRLKVETDDKLCARLKGLHLYCKLNVTMLAGILDRTERTYDRIAGEFNGILDEVEEFSNLSAASWNGPTGILNIVLFVLVKCRDYGVRRRAQWMLMQAESSEIGRQWSAQRMFSMINDLLSVEERERRPNLAGEVPVEARIGFVETDWDLDKRTMTCVAKKFVPGSGPQSYTFVSTSDTFSGPAKVNANLGI